MCGSNEMMTIIPMLIFDVGLIFADNVSDIRLIVTWYTSGNSNFATAMLIPFFLNVSSNIYHWWKWDSRSEKKYTWLLIFLQLWPIYRAIKLAIKIFKKLPGAEEEKKKFEAEIVTLEPYLESLPSVFVMAMAWSATRFSQSNYTAVLGDSPTQFYVTFSISVLTSTLGITKYLLKGPFRILPEKGFLNGMITCRFFFLYITIVMSVMGKVFFSVYYTYDIYTELYMRDWQQELPSHMLILQLSMLFDGSSNNITTATLYNKWSNINSTFSDDYEVWNSLTELSNFTSHQISRLNLSNDVISQMNLTTTNMQSTEHYFIPSFAIAASLIFLPQLIISIIGILPTTGPTKQCPKVISGHPQVCFLAMFTHFVIASRRLGCIAVSQDDVRKRQLILSKKLTILSMLVHIVSVAVCCFLHFVVGLYGDSLVNDVVYIIYIYCTLIIPGILLTSSFLCLGNRCCCPCCVTGCCRVYYQSPDVIHKKEMDLN